MSLKNVEFKFYKSKEGIVGLGYVGLPLILRFVEESPAVELMELLAAKGSLVSYADPYVPVFPKMRKHHFNLVSVEYTAEIIATMDCVVIAIDHDAFDYDMIQKNSKLIVDTRGRYRKHYDNVVKA